MKILVSDSLSESGIEKLTKVPGFEVDVNTKLSPEEFRQVIKDFDALVIRSGTKVSAQVLENAQNLKVIGRAGIGLDNVDIDAASKLGIVVMNTPEGNVITTAEHAIAMMLALTRNIPQASSSLKNNVWEKKRFKGKEVFNKVLGVIGVGRIGRVVAERAQGLKMQVIGYDPYINPEVIDTLGSGRNFRGALREIRLHYHSYPHDFRNPKPAQCEYIQQNETGRFHHQLRARRNRKRAGSL